MNSAREQSINLKTAQGLIVNACSALAEERIALAECLNRFPGSSLTALEALPGYDQSLRDGYAVAKTLSGKADESVRSFAIVDEVAAGDTRKLVLSPGEAVRIMTGGLVPLHCESVVPQESCKVVNDTVVIAATALPQKKTFIYAQGSEIGKGKVIVPQGSAISPEQQILLAGVGYETVPVIRKPQVSFFCTGSELLTGTEERRAGKKFSANSHLLQGLIALAGAELQEQKAVRDDPDSVVKILAGMSRSGCDIIISTGGMGPGKFDLIEEAFSSIGGEVIYRSLHLRPGRSTLFGMLGRTFFFGMPGPPPAVHLLFNELIQPAILALQGAKHCVPREMRARLIQDLYLPKRGLPRLKGCRLSFKDGQCLVRPSKRRESSNCYIYCPATRRQIRTDEKVTIHLIPSSPTFG